MHHDFIDIASHLPAFYRRPWLILAVAWLVCLPGWLGVSFVPDRYVASARVHLETESLLQPLLRGITVDVDARAQVEVMQRTLISRPNLERVVRMADLNTAGAAGPQLDSLIAALQRRIEIKADHAGLFTISYNDDSPKQAYRVVQALLDVFVESRQGSTRQELGAAHRFLTQQVQQYEERMREAEAALAKYKQENMGLLPGGTTFLEVFGRAQTEAQQNRAELQDLLAREADLNRQLATQPAYVETDPDGMVVGGPPSNLEVRILELEQRLDDLRVRYTDKHPEVVKTVSMLEQLRKEMVTHGAADGEAGKTRTLMPNDVRRTIQMQLVEVQSQTAALRSRIDRKTQELQDLRGKISRVPEVEGQMARLERDLQMTRRSYEELVARQETATISESRENLAEKVQFKVIDPPQVPTVPSGLKRSLLLTAVLAAGLLLGCAISVAQVMVQNTFLNAAQLARVTGLPVLGAVGISVASAPRRNLPRLAGYALGLAALMAAYAGLMVAEHDIGLARLRHQLVGGTILAQSPGSAPVSRG
jgi:polysaccharide chain length determinant protein (PEP-CTERM system associated)